MDIKKYFVKILRETADNIDVGNTEYNEEQALQVMEMIAHQPMSKEAASIYLNMSTKNFDALVRKGAIPKGRKRIGFKELVWYKDELDKCKSRNKRQ